MTCFQAVSSLNGIPPDTTSVRVFVCPLVAMLKPSQMKLWAACEAGDVAEVRRCYEDGADYKQKNRFGWTALHRSCMGGSSECVELALPPEPEARALALARPDTEGNSPLHIAAGCAHAAVVTLLLREGAKPGVRKGTAEELKEDGATPMHTACKALADTKDPQRQERLIDTIIALLSGGGLLEATDEKGKLAAAFLPKPLLFRLLTRVKQEELGGSKAPAPPPTPLAELAQPPPTLTAESQSPPTGENPLVVPQPPPTPAAPAEPQPSRQVEEAAEA